MGKFPVSTYHSLTPEEYYNNNEVKKQHTFDQLIHTCLGQLFSPSNLKEIDPDIVTPHYNLYEDDFEGTHKDVPSIDNDVNAETGDTYISTKVKLPIGGVQNTGTVK